MSRQFNFFSLGEDEKIVTRTIFEVFGEVVLLSETGAQDELVVRRIFGADELDSSRLADLVFLAKSGLEDEICFREISSNRVRVDFQNSPVLEYSPSRADGSRSVKVGRLAFFYDGNAEMNRDVAVLFRRIKKQATQLPGTPGLWIFPHAKQNAEILQQWVGSAKPNPFIRTGPDDPDDSGD